MLIHSILDNSSVNGPGDRAVVWFQGCELRCSGCWNQDTWKFTGKHWMVNELVNRISRIPGIEGVTFSGGEPLHQLDDGLDLFIAFLKQEAPRLSFGMYTGYTEQELSAGNFRWTVGSNRRAPKYKKAEAWSWLKKQLDFAVMGRFNQDQLDASRPMCSSRNQQLVLFSDRYKLSDFRPQEAEVHIEDDLVTITGFPTGDLV